METHPNGAWRTALTVLLLVCAVAMLLRAPGFRGAIQDDAFIYFRIAEHAAHGQGPVFNPGDRVDAATSPVWLWSLAAAARAGVPPPLAAVVLGCIAGLAACLWSARWALELSAARRPLEIAVAVAFPAVFLLDARSAYYGFSGMETLAAAFAWTAATRALMRRFWLQHAEPRAGWWVLLAGLVRPEYALVAAILCFLAWRRRQVAPGTIVRALAPALAGAGVYLLAHTLYYGEPWPNTWIAKRQSDLVHLRIGLAYLAGLPRQYPWFVFGFAALAVRALRPAATAILVAIAVYALHIASLGGDHFVFYRPFVIVLPVMLALAGAAAAHACRAPRAWARPAVAAIAAITLAGSAWARVQPGAFAWVRAASQLGHALARTYPPTTRVGLFAIGATGFTSRLPVVDALGLADRHVARRDLSHEHACVLDIGHERGDPAYLLAQADIIVPFAAFAPVRFESLDEVREGFYSHKKFLAAARAEVAAGRLRLRNIEFAPNAYWLVLERTRARAGTTEGEAP